MSRLPVYVAAVAVALASAGCVSIATETRLLEFDASASRRSPALDEDRVSVALTASPQGRETRVTANILATILVGGPYTLRIEVSPGRRAESWLDVIEVSEAVLEIRYDDGEVKRLELSTAPDDWKRSPYTVSEFRQLEAFTLAEAKMPGLSVADFERLREIRFRLKFTGIYANSDRRDYWVEQYLRPKVLHDTAVLWIT